MIDFFRYLPVIPEKMTNFVPELLTFTPIFFPMSGYTMGLLLGNAAPV
ncbi:hypothetical protein HMPREF9441_03707 [Paraprevotella clara YIT 11840]|uniref:Uncharacterized protein n=1 Tax=Paraprevotella clara YIT 11840 TaxID=762968 RepID=G5SWD4_9BACT|nr:hypothetical protein HMPREF9441_03707 [Paraprevotella clara YIT 11840]